MLPFEKAWVVGSHEGILDTILDAYKFEHKRAVFQDLVDLLDTTVPVIPVDTVITAVPTISRHIRLRGFDHTELIARRFARMRHLS